MSLISESRNKVASSVLEGRKSSKSFFANIFGRMAPAQEFDKVKISIASPEQIRSWSFGEVTKPETINYRTFKPERDGLFCAHIFGPVKDYECLCGKYKRMKYRGVVCEKCGVEVTLSKVRRERMGHIELAASVAHIWFTKSLPSRIGTLLDLSSRDLDKILYFESYVVVDPGITMTKRGQVLTPDEMQQLDNAYGVRHGSDGPKAFDADSGAEALHKLLKAIDLEKDREMLRGELIVATSELRRKKILKRLRLVEAFIHSKTRPEWMVMQVLPVIPADLRPLVPLEVGRFAAADLNDLYRRVIHRNNRLKRLLIGKAPRIMVHNEKRMLQEIVDALFDNGRRGRPILGAHKKPLKPLADTLRGKRGRFRQNLLGKRVDFSGRSVIVVGPDLKLHQCGLPKKMALELFKPFVYSKLESYGLAPTIKAAKRMVEKEQPEVWDVLEEVIRQHPVLLNRAPTLHRLGIQGFEPVLTEGKAIKLHPLVCGAYNADFDGDQMGVYVPLSVEAQLEARVLMMSTNNILSPAHGSPVILPSKDMVLGLYYMTMAPTSSEKPRLFGCSAELHNALESHMITLHSPIRISIFEMDAEGCVRQRVVETTPGRYILGGILPQHSALSFDLINCSLNSADLSKIVGLVHRHCGQKETVVFSDRLMDMGFRYATRSGISFGKDDLIVPKEKNELIDQTRQRVLDYRKQYLDGLITAGERYNKVTDAWAKCSEHIAKVMMERLSSTVFDHGLSSAFLIVNSGARGSLNQMRQLAAFRGLIAKHSGEVIENPILSNFKEGLSVLEYYISTYGARKGVSDVSLGTANAGYLTRRLVDVGQDCIITELDCGSERGLRVSSIVRGEEIISSLGQQILGRVTLEAVHHPVTGEMIVDKKQMITEELVELIESARVDSINVRSVIMCTLQRGLCAMCYGRDLARGALVNPGEAVGIIAAQSIGEPGTQLTMRTFHSGGAAQRASEVSFLQASLGGIVRLKNCRLLRNQKDVSLVNCRHAEIMLVDAQDRERERYKLPYGAALFCQEGDEVAKGAKLAEWDPYMLPLMTESSGVVRFVDLVEGVSLREVIDESTGISKRVVSDWKQIYRGAELRPRFILTDEAGLPLKLASGMEARYFLSVDTILNVEDGSAVYAGDILASLPRESSKSRDIIGGLPRIVELFEARRPKDSALMSEHDGRLEFGKDYKTKRRLCVIPDDSSLVPAEYVIPKGKYVLLQEGDEVKRGDILVDGPLAPQDILRILGVEAVAYHMINEIQEVYRLQGVRINDKHLEVIIRQMLQKIEITDPGDTLWVAGDHVDYRDLNAANQKLAKGKRPGLGYFVLQGLTKASLQTNSFISSASFQETTRVLTEAAVWGKEDPLLGLKENVIVGHLIPAGTGSVIASFKNDITNRLHGKKVISSQKGS